MNDYKKINKEAWNIKTDIHINSEFYDNDVFLKGKNSLNRIELDLLGDIKGKSILHLQCHFGQDTMSLSRMGAKVVGMDISDKAINTARKFASKLSLDTEFVCCDLYDLPNHLDKQFDIVFTSYGVIGWLPDLDKWGEIVAHFMKPGGRFVFAEFHPVVWMFDDNFKTIKYNYFNVEKIVEDMEGTYADKEAPVRYNTVSWNHSISEIVNGLIKAGMQIKRFDEFDYSPYPCFNSVEESEIGKYRIKHLGDKIPMVFALEGTK